MLQSLSLLYDLPPSVSHFARPLKVPNLNKLHFIGVYILIAVTCYVPPNKSFRFP